MQNQDEPQANPKSNRRWLVIGGVVLACLCLAVVGAFALRPIIESLLQGSGDLLPVLTASGTPAPADTSTPSAATAPTGGPAAGGRADALLKSDVWNAILGFYARNKGCTDVTNTGIEVTKAPDSQGIWQEAWTVRACGATAVMNVEFTPSPQGGTDYKITP